MLYEYIPKIMRITANTQRGLRSNEIIVTESVQIKGFGKSVKNISEREREQNL